MRSIRLAVVGTAGLAVGWWLVHRSPTGDAGPDVATTARVLADLCTDMGGNHGRDLRWGVTHDSPARPPGGASSLEITTTQTGPASVEINSRLGRATISTSSWRLSVDLPQVTEVVCERHFHHVPEPGFVELYVSFRYGPDDDDAFPRELFRVGFDETRDEPFRQFCDHHGLRKVGDF